MQGLLELAGIPYVGCGVLASAVCMDKAVANALFDAAGIPHTRWLAANRWEIESDLEGVCDGAIAKLGWPIFVKPANAGSSVGITKAHDRAVVPTDFKFKRFSAGVSGRFDSSRPDTMISRLIPSKITTKRQITKK